MSEHPKRGRKPAPDTERKDRVIQTRVPKDLESTLKEAAERERVSVSHLIRNVLEDTFNLVDNIIADSAQLVDTVRRDASKLAASARRPELNTEGKQAQPTVEGPSIDDVEAWQEVLVNKPVPCANCGLILARGAKALRGLSATSGAASVWLCPPCLSKI
ncbi:MAG: hypothetical protein KBT87_00145 [Gammaproteobacteria bacterium]|nr:hypothetical protein [Gammaproteobacteria bacterium]MBQ0773063.1 hypothetical protein [Gammaproteobacteria bacterium]